MCNATEVAKRYTIAACAVAIALLTISVGVKSTWAGSDQQAGLKFTPISSEMVVYPLHARQGHLIIGSMSGCRSADGALSCACQQPYPVCCVGPHSCTCTKRDAPCPPLR
jgi:hypothetical protein